MSLSDQLHSDMKQSMKNRDELKLSTIRMIISSVSYAKIAKGAELTDEEVLTVLAKEAKQRRESVDAAEKGGRLEFAQRERDELSVISAYLPAQLGEDEVEVIVRELVAQLGVTSIKDRGKLMGPLMAKIKGRADGKLASQVVENVLRD